MLMLPLVLAAAPPTLLSHSSSSPLPSSISSLLVFPPSFPCLSFCFLDSSLIPCWASSPHLSLWPLRLLPCCPVPPLPAAQTHAFSVLHAVYSHRVVLLALAVFPASLFLSPVCVCLGLAKSGLWPQTVLALPPTLNLHPPPAPPTLDFLSAVAPPTPLNVTRIWKV